MKKNSQQEVKRMEQIMEMVQRILLYFKDFEAAAVIGIIKDFFAGLL